MVVTLQRPKVSLDVEWSKVRQGDGILESDDGLPIVPTGHEHADESTQGLSVSLSAVGPGPANESGSFSLLQSARSFLEI